MAHKPALNEEENKYVLDAIRSGTMGRHQIELVLLVGRLTGKPVLEVQSAYMDCRVGIQQVFQEMAKELEVKE